MVSRSPHIQEKLRGGRPYIKFLRYLCQWMIVLIVIYGGVSLHIFHRYLGSGEVPPLEKPLSVEGFMPIGALMSLKLWIVEGAFDPVHPAALIIFISALLLAVLLKKGFCGWICPVGTLSELIWKTGEKVSRRNFVLPGYLDYPLRGIKYFLMAFFLYVILIKMSSESIGTFLFTPYWKVADMKLLLFFTNMSITTMIVLTLLVIFSFFIKNAWCRYLCPYGAFLGLLSMLSPLKVTRNESKCIHCHGCTRRCPSLLKIEEKERVGSPECIGCLTCVSACPSAGALDIGFSRKRRINPLLYIGLIAIIFWGSILAGRATEKWESNVTFEEYKAIVPYLDRLMHP